MPLPFEGMNVTGNIAAGGGSGLWFPLLIVTIIIVAGVIALILSSFSRYKALRGFFGFLEKSLGYFGKGLIVAAIFGAAYMGVELLAMGIVTGTIDVIGLLWVIGMVIGGFFGTAGLGYVFDKLVWKRITSYNKRYKKEKK
jgi:hypothetical protein